MRRTLRQDATDYYRYGERKHTMLRDALFVDLKIRAFTSRLRILDSRTITNT